MPFKNRSSVVFAILILCALESGVQADPLAPVSKQWDLELGDMIGFVQSPSFVQVRENDINGTQLDFSDLGLRPVQVPNLSATYWFTGRSALNVQFRYFAVAGSHTFDAPVEFNGATVAAGQSLKINPAWYSLGVYYNHRWTPDWLKKGDVRGLFGIEYTSINFRFDSGHAPVTPGSGGTETKEGFEVQELPLPTLGVEVRQRVSTSLFLSGAVSGNWINHWNSQRQEGGTIYLSQRKLEAHVRLNLADNRRFKFLHPMAGLFYYDFRQEEQSHEDGNVIRLAMFGPELGIGVEF